MWSPVLYSASSTWSSIIYEYRLLFVLHFCVHCSVFFVTCWCAQEQENCCPLDLSSGLESVPILLGAAPSAEAASTFDESYNYICTTLLHESVTAEALACARAMDMFCVCSSEEVSPGTAAVDSAVHAHVETAYTLDSTLLPKYITQVTYCLR